jgi:hypothetical protein
LIIQQGPRERKGPVSNIDFPLLSIKTQERFFLVFLLPVDHTVKYSVTQKEERLRERKIQMSQIKIH